MTQWYVKELSQLTKVSVQTLHHYDRIDLLKPSVRLSNGYRLYSEKDLLKLQQIVALKFFGFDLSQIKNLLNSDVDVKEHFAAQSQLLKEKAKGLLEASQALENITSDCYHNKSIPWEKIIQLIEVYRMTQQLEKTWAGRVFTSEELKDYATFEKEVKTRFTESENQSFKKAWQSIVEQVNSYLEKDPQSDLGISMGKKTMDWVNAYYGTKHIKLRNAIWEKGFKEGEINEEGALSKTGFFWLDQAISAYYRERILNILNKAGSIPEKAILKEWEELLVDMHGDEQEPKNKIFDAVLNDSTISDQAKEWLKKYIHESQYNK